MIIKSLSPVPIRHLGAFWGPAMTLNIEDPAALHVSTVTVLGTELPAGGEEGPHGGPGTPRRALPWPGCLCTARAAARRRGCC